MRRSPRRMWRKWRQLSSDERRTLAQAVWLVPAMHIVVRVAGFNRLQAWLNRLTPQAPGDTSPRSVQQVLRVAVDSVNRVKRFSPLPGNCLSQSLALTRLLRRRGVGPALRLGVRFTGPTFEAHAWVEYNGRVLNDTQDVHTRYTPLVEKPGAR